MGKPRFYVAHGPGSTGLAAHTLLVIWPFVIWPNSDPFHFIETRSTTMPILGAHMSIAGGYYKAVEAAEKAGCDCVQLFTHTPSN